MSPNRRHGTTAAQKARKATKLARTFVTLTACLWADGESDDEDLRAAVREYRIAVTQERSATQEGQ